MDAESVVSQVQRKIELQDPEDLAYLLANVRRAAAERLDEAFPPVATPEGGGGSGDDDLRDQIAALVNDYIDKTFSLAAPNLSINGLPVTEAQIRNATQSDAQTEATETYEPFDGRKRRRVADLIAAEEKLLEEVAALKRAVPSTAASAHAASVRDSLVRDDQLLRERVERAAALPVRVNVSPLERQGAVEASFRGAVDTLGKLKRDMPAVVAKMERARVAGEYVVTDGK